MKVEASKPELIEAWLYGAVGAGRGIIEHVIKPAFEDQPIALYALCGVLGGLAVSRIAGRD